MRNPKLSSYYLLEADLQFLQSDFSKTAISQHKAYLVRYKVSQHFVLDFLPVSPPTQCSDTMQFHCAVSTQKQWEVLALELQYLSRVAQV